MTHPAYRAGCILRAIRDAFPGRVTPAAMGKCAARPDLMPTYLRHVWGEATRARSVAALLAGWEPAPPDNPAESEGVFWLGYYHQGSASALPGDFGPRLKALREKAGLTGAELAEKAGTTRQTVHNLESGTFRPSWDMVQRLADALSVPTDAFRDR